MPDRLFLIVLPRLLLASCSHRVESRAAPRPHRQKEPKFAPSASRKGECCCVEFDVVMLLRALLELPLQEMSPAPRSSSTPGAGAGAALCCSSTTKEEGLIRGDPTLLAVSQRPPLRQLAANRSCKTAASGRPSPAPSKRLSLVATRPPRLVSVEHPQAPALLHSPPPTATIHTHTHNTHITNQQWRDKESRVRSPRTSSRGTATVTRPSSPSAITARQDPTW